MRNRWQKPGWILVAAIAIMAVLVLALAPQVHSTASTGWLPVLPLVLFIGVITPLQPPAIPGFGSVLAAAPRHL